MTPAGAGAAAAGVTAGAGTVVASWASPLPVLVTGGLLLIALTVVAVVVLTAARSRDKTMQEQALQVLDRLIAAIPGSRALAASSGADSHPAEAPADAGES